MAPDLMLSVFAIALVGSVAAIGFCLTLFHVLRNSSRCMTPSGVKLSVIGSTLRKDRFEIPSASRLFIMMPDRLRTHDEMIGWMVEELPKLTVDLMRSKP